MRRYLLPGRLFVAVAALLAAALLCASPAVAAEQEIVGVLALVVVDDVAAKLDLSDEQHRDLLDLIDSREADAASLVAGLKGLSLSERMQQLAPYRRESEIRGWVLLTREQRTKLKLIWVQRAGYAAAADREIGMRLKLTDDQKVEITKLLDERAEQLSTADPASARLVAAAVDQKLAAVLTDAQMAVWNDLLAGAPVGGLPPTVATTIELVDPGPEAGQATELPPAITAKPADVMETLGLPPTDGQAAKIIWPGMVAPPAVEMLDSESDDIKAVEIDEPGTMEAAEPEAVETEAAEIVEPESADSGMGEISEPIAAETEVTEPEVAEPEVVETEAAEMEMTEPEAVEIETAKPEGPEAVETQSDEMTAPTGPDEGAVEAIEPVAPETYRVEPTESEAAEAVEMIEPEVSDPGATDSTVAAAPDLEEPIKLKFNFRFQPWDEVLDWFAQQADLSMVLDSSPPGTFNYTDAREYTPAEAIDLLNSVLLTKGYTLLRRDRMLMLINLEDGIPPNLVPTIPIEDLDNRGEFELVNVLFQLVKLDPEEANEEIQKLLGPQGTVVVLAKSQQILVTETAGRLKTIRRVIQAIEDPSGLASGQLRSFELKYVTPEEVLLVVRQLLAIAEDQNSTEDGSLRFALDPISSRLLATGKPEMLSRFTEIVEQLDAPDPLGIGDGGIIESPQIVVYSVSSADPNSVLQVMQTLLAGSLDARLALDPQTNALVALARPSEHATIRATLDEMQSDIQLLEVIQLYVLDPQVAVAAITKMFGIGSEEEGGNTSGLTIDADPNSRQLIVRGSSAQISQIRELLDKLGEAGAAQVAAEGGGNVRVLPLSTQAAHTALEQIQQIWPTMRTNKIRQVTPSAVIPTMRVNEPTRDDPAATEEMFYQLLGPDSTTDLPPIKAPPQFRTNSMPGIPPAKQPPPSGPDSSSATPPNDKSAAAPIRSTTGKMFLVAQTGDGTTESGTPRPPTGGAPPEIIVSIGPGGLVIASQDTEALDQLEDLIDALTNGSYSGTPQLTVYYLKYAKAASVGQTLDQILGGGTLATSSSGGSMMGDMAEAAFGDAGGILGTLLSFGSGGTIAPTGAIKITPEVRLNALLVEANPVDLNTIEQLLKILDQMESPEEIMAVAKPRLIPVYNTRAEGISEIVKQMYQDRMVTSSGGGQSRQPSAADFIAAMQSRGGGPGARGGSSRGGATEEVQKMSVGVDSLSNSVIVSAPEPLFQEVKDLVETLDKMAVDSNQTMETFQLHRTNAQTVQQALSALVGDSVQFSSGQSSRSGRPSGQPSSQSRSGSSTGGSSPSFDDIRRRIEAFRTMQGGGGPGGSRSGGGGGPGGGRSGGGGGPGGGGRPSGGGGSR